MRPPSTLIVLLLGLLLAGCAGGEEVASPQPLQTVPADLPEPDQVLIEDDIFYEPTTIEMPADDPGFLLFIDNVGEAPHDFTVEGLPDDIDVHMGMAPGISGPYPLPGIPAGEYTFYCGVEGHREAGMEGTLIVS